MERTFYKNRGIGSLLPLLIILISLMSFSYYHVVDLKSPESVVMQDIQSDIGGESKEENIGAENQELSDKYIDQLALCSYKFLSDKTEIFGCPTPSFYGNIPDKPVNPPRV